MKGKIAKILVFLGVLILIGIGGFFLKSKLKGWEKISWENLLQKINKEIVAPPPLREEERNPQAYLTKNGIILWTNQQRKDNGISSLRENVKLNKAAEMKINDMFERQYFAHVSYDGKGPDFWVEKANYQYITIGENLALGDFKNDQKLVEAWMNSEGHRENILNKKYTEIGVAVKKGWIEGRYTFLAVQMFGKPLSSCPQVDENLKKQIDSLKFQLQTLENQLLTLKAEIEKMSRKDPQYEEKVNQYNSLVVQYNELLSYLKSLVEEYNRQVQILNNCIQS